MSFAKLALIFVAAHVASGLYYLSDVAPGTTAALGGFPLDDAWIHMVYARSLASLQGFAYNPGQLETGSTSPLWAMLLVPASLVARFFAISVVLPAKVTGVLAGAAASLAGARAARMLGLGLATQMAAGIAIAVDPALAFAQVSGMEVMLTSAMALLIVSELATDRLWPASIAAGLAPLARPELILLGLPAVAVIEWRLHKRGAHLLTRLAMLAPSLACVGGWMIYCQLVSGYPLPSTFYAKFTSRPEYFSHNVALLFGGLLPSWPWFARGTGFFLWALGAAVLLRQGLVGRLAAIFPLIYLFAIAGSRSFPQAEPFYWQRYFQPALPLILLSVAVGGVHVVGWAWQRRHQSWAPARAVAAAVLVVGSLSGLPSAWRKSSDLYAWNCQNIEELNVAMARWLHDNTDPGETIAVTDAGAIRYFSGRPVFDMIGLNNYRFLHHDGTAPLAIDQVRVVAAFPSLLAWLRDNPAWRSVHEVATRHLTICDCPQSEMVAYRRIKVELVPSP